MTDNDTLIVIDFHTGDRQVFRNPVEIVSALDCGDVCKALDRVRQAQRDGFYAAGFVSYEAGPAFDPAIEAQRSDRFPLAWFAIFDQPANGLLAPPSDLVTKSVEIAWAPEISDDGYRSAIDRIHEAILNGETYQVNYTFRLRSEFTGDPLAFYLQLIERHPARYSALISTADFSIVSNSPELFFSWDANRIIAEPMKGTSVRGRHAAEDVALAALLRASEKDRAENVMIVDLMRSDLGKIARIGTVKTPRLFDLRALPTVWQMTSTILCEPEPDLSLADLFRAAFPPGSVTGAPKPRTTQIIAEIEVSPRKIYCGAIGLLDPTGKTEFNVAIRTVVIDHTTQTAECGVGGGITIDSIAASEYDEALAKSRFLTNSAPDFALLESILLEDGGYFLLERHLRRLEHSANLFGYTYDTRAIRTALDELAHEYPNGAYKVRLLSAKSGAIELTAEPAAPLSGAQAVSLAKSPIDTTTPFVYNKTTHRAMYAHHRAEAPPGTFDTLLWNDRGHATEFTIGNLVVRRADRLITPEISCGLLPGTFREQLLEEGIIEEGIVKTDEIGAYDEIWLINSVRKWVTVRLTDHPHN